MVLAAEPAAQRSLIERYSPLLPVGVAIVLLLIAPLITEAAKSVLFGHIKRDTPESDTRQIPDYVEYVSDFMQIIPAGVLPTITALLAAAADINTTIGVVAAVISFGITVVLLLCVIRTSPSNYVTKNRLGPYSAVVLFAIGMNVVCGVVIGVFICYSSAHT